MSQIKSDQSVASSPVTVSSISHNNNNNNANNTIRDSLAKTVPSQVSLVKKSLSNDILSTHNAASPNATAGASNTNIQNSASSSLPNQYRVDMEILIDELTSTLGKDNWAKYAQFLSLFMLGKLSRKELFNELKLNIFKGSSYSHLLNLHNQILISIYNNSIRGSSNSNDFKNNMGWGFSNNGGLNGSNNGKLKYRINKHNSQIETYKKIVMSLPNTDRKRLKQITKESGKRGFILCSVLQSRLNLIPKIPVVTNPETLKRVKANNLKTPLEWSQDIMNGFNAQLSTEGYSLPDNDTLFLKMVGVAREHGLVGTVNAQCVQIVSAALDQYLKDIVSSVIDTIRYREKRYSDYYDIDENGIYRPVSETTDINNINTDKSGGDNNNTSSQHEDPPSSSSTALTSIFSRQNSVIPNATDVSTSSPLSSSESSSSTNPQQQSYHPPILSLTGDDLYNSLEIFPNTVDHSGSYFDMTNSLINDDQLIEMDSCIDDLPEFNEPKPSFTPVDKRNVGSRKELNWLIKDILTDGTTN